MKIGTPAYIEVLLHCHTTPGTHPRSDAPVVSEAITAFVSEGIITPDTRNRGGYTTTPKGKAWVLALCNVKCPRTAYVDEAGNILELV